MDITFRKLMQLFPKDTMWVDGGCDEIIGYSPKENLHIVIDDGQCTTNSGIYFVHKYRPSDLEGYLMEWKSKKYPWRYLGKDKDKISDEWVNFNL